MNDNDSTLNLSKDNISNWEEGLLLSKFATFAERIRHKPCKSAQSPNLCMLVSVEQDGWPYKWPL